MVLALTAEEKRALQLFGVYDCHNAGQLLQREDLIRRVYRKRALTTHPDRAVLTGRDPIQMERAFQRVSESYRLLMEKIVLQKGSTPSPQTVRVNKGKAPRAGRQAGHVAVGYYKGYVPQKKLRFAEYLYYRRMITWEQLVASLSWQFMNRPKLGELARDKGWLDSKQVMVILKKKKSSQRFGLVAVQQGYISVERCKSLLVLQRNLGLPIGKYFQLEGILGREALDRSLMEFIVHNRQFRTASP